MSIVQQRWSSTRPAVALGRHRRGSVPANRPLFLLLGATVVVATLSISVAPATAYVETKVCGWNADPTYKSDLRDELYSNPSGATKVGNSRTYGRYHTAGCLAAYAGYWVRVTYAQWRWNAGTPSVCDIGSNGVWMQATNGLAQASTYCAAEGWTHSQVAAHGIAIYGSWVDTGLYAASEA